MAIDDGKQRPVIGAMWKGPGPAKYYLPSTVGYLNHDATKNKKPGYVFGLKTVNKGDTKRSPGPAAYSVADRSTRYGADGTPKYSLHYRPKTCQNFNTPGPDAYKVEKEKIFKQKTAPCYSFGSRTRYHKKDHTPGPNAYSMPNLLGMGIPSKSAPPSYSMRGRPRIGGFSEDLQKSPGPGTYKIGDANSWRKKAPCYSISGRNLMPGDSTQNLDQENIVLKRFM